MIQRLVALSLLLLAACGKPPSGGTCDVAPQVALDAKERPDGVYGVVGDAIETTPLQTFDHLTLSGEGVDASNGKRWLKIHAAAPDGARLSEFTRAPVNHSIAVIVGGKVASHHKIRQPIDGADFQVSCCDPAACDRWLSNLKR